MVDSQHWWSYYYHLARVIVIISIKVLVSTYIRCSWFTNHELNSVWLKLSQSSSRASSKAVQTVVTAQKSGKLIDLDTILRYSPLILNLFKSLIVSSCLIRSNWLSESRKCGASMTLVAAKTLVAQLKMSPNHSLLASLRSLESARKMVKSVTKAKLIVAHGTMALVTT